MFELALPLKPYSIALCVEMVHSFYFVLDENQKQKIRKLPKFRFSLIGHKIFWSVPCNSITEMSAFATHGQDFRSCRLAMSTISVTFESLTLTQYSWPPQLSLRSWELSNLKFARSFDNYFQEIASIINVRDHTFTECFSCRDKFNGVTFSTESHLICAL